MVFDNYPNSTRTSEASRNVVFWSFSLTSGYALVSGLIIPGLGDQIPHPHKSKFLKNSFCFLVFEGSSLVILGYHLLPRATIAGNLRLPVYFEMLYPIWVVENFKGSLLATFDYYCSPPETTHLVG